MSDALWKSLRTFLLVILTLWEMHCGAAGVVRFSAPPSGLLSLPVYRMIDTGSLDSDGIQIELVPWKSPEQLRAIVLSAQADVIGMPTNTAANFHNHGARIRLLDVVIWKAVWIVSSEADVGSLTDLRGREILMPFRGELPEILFQVAATRAGMDPEKDFIVRPVGSAQSAAAMLIAGTAHTAVLSEPSCSAAIARATSGTLTLRRVVDLQEAAGSTGLPLAGLAMPEESTVSRQIVARFVSEYAAATDWCNRHPREAARLMQENVPSVTAFAVEDSIRHAVLKVRSGVDARSELEDFFTILMSLDAAKTGGRMPGDAFFGGADAPR